MRGSDERTGSLFSFVDLEERVPQRHPLRKIRQIVNEALTSLDGEFARLYSSEGRPSIAPERLLRASLLQAFFSVRSERQLMEQLDYNLMFRWFVGLGVDDAVWDATVFTKNRDRLHEEPRPAARCRGGGEVHGRRSCSPRGEAAAVERPFLGRRYARRGMGEPEELPSQRRLRRAAGSRPQWRAQLSSGKA